MPRYFFHVIDGLEIRDDQGVDLPHMNAVRAYAMQASGDMLKGGGHPDLWNGEDWKMIVTDEAGREVAILRFSAQQVAA
jgi:hypothetical protein